MELQEIKKQPKINWIAKFFSLNIENRSKYYTVLGLTENASQDEIKKSYKSLAKKYHPDIHHGKSEKEIEENEKKFREVTEAYEKLKTE